MPEIKPMADVPDIVRRGQVRAHLVSFMADGPDDGQAPDEQPLSGYVTLTPTVMQMKWPTADPPRTAVMQTILCPILDGWLYPPGTETPSDDPAVESGVWVVATEQPEGLPNRVQWRASFELTNVRSQPESVTFDVPDRGTVDLTTVLPTSPDPGVIVVVSTEDRERAEAAATSILGQVDAANDAAATATTKAAAAAASALAAAGSAATAETIAATVQNAVNTAVSSLRSELLGKTILKDTGWINIQDQLLDGWTCTLMRIRRIGNQMFLETYGLNGNAATGNNIWQMPSGFQPTRTIFQNSFTIKHDSRNIQRSRQTNPLVGDTWAGAITTWITNAAWPGAYPSIT